MADDLKLQLVIEALLDAKGFEDAKTNLNELVLTANKSSSVTEKTGASARKMGQSFGGVRGPVADLTRVLLINTGVTTAAGQAAKAAGTAALFMAGATSAVWVAASAGIAAIAVLLPKLMEWIEATKKQRKEQEQLKQQLEEQIGLLNTYAAMARTAGEAARTAFEPGRAEQFNKEAAELFKLNEQFGFSGDALLMTSEAYALARKRQEDLTEAQKKGITVEELFTERIKEHAKAIDEDLVGAQMRQAQEQLDAAGQLLAFNEAARKEQERVAREGIEKPSTAAERRRKLEEEAELILAQIKNTEDLAEAKAMLAEAERLQTAQGLSNIAATAGALSSLFGRNKALAIAEALVNAAAGSVAAGRDTPGPVWVRVAAIAAFWATALAQIQAIRSAEPVGFDDPFADVTARRLGRRSAEDFARHFGGEFVGRLPGAMMSQAGVVNNTTINRGTTINGGLTLPGFMGAGRTEFMKHFNRELTKTSRLERRTTVGR